jgi:hypothetical protein
MCQVIPIAYEIPEAIPISGYVLDLFHSFEVNDAYVYYDYNEYPYTEATEFFIDEDIDNSAELYQSFYELTHLIRQENIIEDDDEFPEPPILTRQNADVEYIIPLPNELPIPDFDDLSDIETDVETDIE